MGCRLLSAHLSFEPEPLRPPPPLPALFFPPIPCSSYTEAKLQVDKLTNISPLTASIPEPQREAWTKHQVKGFRDKDNFENEVVRHVETTLARSMFNCDESAAYAATSLAFRDRLILEWNKTQQRQTFADSKRVYYLSLEFLMGRALDNAMLNIGQRDVAKAGLSELGFRIEDIIQQEHDAALGNGGLGRLAACFLDSLASLNFPAWGYGLRYRYGIFKQTIEDGYQVEEPDYWLGKEPPAKAMLFIHAYCASY